MIVKTEVIKVLHSGFIKILWGKFITMEKVL